MLSYLFKDFFTHLLSLLKHFLKIWHIERYHKFYICIYLKIFRWINWSGVFSSGMFSKLKTIPIKSGFFIHWGSKGPSDISQNHKHLPTVFTVKSRTSYPQVWHPPKWRYSQETHQPFKVFAFYHFFSNLFQQVSFYTIWQDELV